MVMTTQDMVTVTPLLPSAFVDVVYTPALLLDARLDASITDYPDFPVACRGGFEGYFDVMYELDEEGYESFVDRCYDWAGVEAWIVGEVVRRYDRHEAFLVAWAGGFPSLSCRAGFMLGWLSALALVDYALAYRGIEALSLLVPACQQEEAAHQDV